jgi:methyl-accepting chemotaxis protein
MFKNITIKARLIFVISLLGTELVAGAAIGLFSLDQANKDIHSLYENQVVCLGQLDHVIRGMNLNQINLSNALTASPNQIPAILSDIKRNSDFIEKEWKAYSTSDMTADEKSEADTYVKARNLFLASALQPAVDALANGNIDAATKIVHGPLKESFSPLRKSIDRLLQIQLDQADVAQQESERKFNFVRLLCLIGMGLGLTVAAVVGSMLIRSIVKPLNEAVVISAAVARGDLTKTIVIDRNDETGRMMSALSDMSTNLSQIVGRVRSGTDAIATASGQIAAGNLDLSSRTEQQAAALEETASSMEQLASTVKQNTDNARQANELAISASGVATQGGALMSRVVDTMNDINASASRIADIITVIDGIAFQTNILALNAAVEAARAGEQGRGFAVVAGEVRALAHRSAEAAREIKILINDSLDKANSGSALVDQAGETMIKIVNSVKMVTSIMSDITSASVEQTAGIDQVTRAITQMDQTTQQNAALVEQASAAAQSLHEEADSLARTVGTFRLNETRSIIDHEIDTNNNSNRKLVGHMV